jgi:hypothetical protein
LRGAHSFALTYMTGLFSHVAVANVGVVSAWRERPADVYTAAASFCVQTSCDCADAAAREAAIREKRIFCVARAG